MTSHETRHQPHGHEHHEHVHLDEEHWAAWAAHAQLEAEVLLGFVTDTAAWVTELRDPGAPAVRRILDVGSGPGVAACELAGQFPEAQVVAVDSSPAMLERATQRAADLGLDARVSTRLAAMPDGLDGSGPADVVWSSLALHHVGDEVAALRALGDLLGPDGLLVVVELDEPMRVLPDPLDLGRPGLADRLTAAERTWFASMRAGLPDAVPSADLASMVAAAGLETVGSRVARQHLGAPLGEDARRLAHGYLRRIRGKVTEHLDKDDVDTLDVLVDADDPRSVLHRPDAVLAASRQVLIARPAGAR
jgi:SAM-dependent methyltransferase